MDCNKKGIAVTAALSLAYTLSGLAIIAYFSSPGVVCGLALVLIGIDIDFAFRIGNIQKLFLNKSKGGLTMDVKCPRCGNEFEIDELIYGDDAKCRKCGLLIGTEYDESYDEEYGESCYGWSDDTPADCCKACENLNLESCVGICKRMDSEVQQEG